MQYITVSSCKTGSVLLLLELIQIKKGEFEHMAHSTHRCRAIVISCMDFRLRKHLRRWASKHLDTEGFDRVAIAGGVKNLPFVLEQIELSYKLHHICEVYLINHEDCGAYGTEGTFEKQKADLVFAKTILQQKFPKLAVIPIFLTLEGQFIPVTDEIRPDETEHFPSTGNRRFLHLSSPKKQ